MIAGGHSSPSPRSSEYPDRPSARLRPHRRARPRHPVDADGYVMVRRFPAKTRQGDVAMVIGQEIG
jgi:hypothetical protein